MPIYSMQAPNGKTYDIEGPEGATEDQVRAEILRRDPTAGAAPKAAALAPTPESKPGDLGRAFRIGTRDVMEGAGSLLDIVGAPVNTGINLLTGSKLSSQPGRDLADYGADALGLEEAQTDEEKLIGKGVEYGTQGLMTAGAGLAMRGAQGTAGMIGTALAETPIRDVAAGVGAGLAEEGTRQAGYGEVAQVLASLGGGVGAYAGLSALPKNLDAAKMTVQQIKDFFTAKGYNISDEEAEAAYRYYEQGGDEAAVVNNPIPEAPAKPSVTSDQMVNQAELPMAAPEHQLGFDFDAAPSENPQTRGPVDPSVAQANRMRAAQADELPIGESAPYKPWEPSQIEMDLQPPVPEATPRVINKKGSPVQGEGYGPEVDALAEKYALRDRLAKASEGPEYKTQDEFNFDAPPPKKAEAPKVEQEYVPSQIERDIAKYTDALTGQWKNAPEVHIYDHFDDAEGIDPKSLGVYDPESGKVLLNSKGIEREAAHRKLSVQEMTNTVLFHEGLGHHGLAQQFRGDLDAALTKWYDSSQWFKREVTRWIEKNADAYADENQIARAGEEVLAELSEAGKMPAKLMDQIKNQIKNYARKLGMDLEFSAREIRTILAQSHEAVISGKKYDVRGNGFRSMKATYGESEGSVQGRAGRENKEGDASVIHKVRSNRQIDEILDEADVEKTKETWGEWQSDADRIKMTTAMAEKLAAGTSPAELIAAEKHAAKLANTISDLSHKAANQTLSPKEADLLKQHIRHLDTTAQAISDVVSNAARILNARKMEIATDETVVQRLLRRMSSSEIEALATPEGARKFALQLAKDQKKAARIEKAVNVLGNILNFTRAIWSSYDLSMWFRQARALAHTPEFWKNMPNAFKYWGNKNFYNMTMDSIKERPTYALMKKHGLAFTELGSDLSKREEAFMSTWAEKIPGVRQSERAYNGYLNKLRADTFDTMYKKLDDTGIDFNSNPKALKDLAHFINNATGRGNLDLGKFGPIAAGVLFSPRLMASRMAMLNPVYYAKLSPGVRAQAIKSAAAFATTSAIFAGLMTKAGFDVEIDPRSSDFMKLKKGDTRYDMLGGYGQYATLYSRLATNQKKNAKGDIVELGKRFGSKDAYDVLGDFVRSKFSPNMSLVVDARLGENVVGEKFDAKKETIKRFVPMIMQDVYKQMESEGAFEEGVTRPDLGKAAVGAVKAAPGVVGVGVQTYPGPSGTDVYGRSYEAEREDTPAITEMKRIEETLGKSPINPPKKKIGDRQLTEEEYNEYQKLAGEWTTQYVEQEMQTEEWAQMTDEEKLDLIREIASDMRENARDELFGE